MKNLKNIVTSIAFTLVMLIGFGGNAQEQVDLEKFEVQKEILFSNIKRLSNSNISVNNEFNKRFIFSSNQKEELIKNSINVLNSLGVPDSVILSEFKGLDSPEILTTALTVSRIVDQVKHKKEVVNFVDGYNYTLGEFTGNGVQSNSVLDCVMDALGVPAGLITGTAKNLGKKAVIKAVKKLATRFLGWVGAAIGVYEFGDCMGYW